jgi:hypothetical protein
LAAEAGYVAGAVRAGEAVVGLEAEELVVAVGE